MTGQDLVYIFFKEKKTYLFQDYTSWYSLLF